MTRVHLLTLREPLVFVSRVEMHSMCERIEIWTSLVSPKQLNMEFSSYVSDELEDLPLVLILVKTKDFGCLPPFSFCNTKGLEVLSFPILLKTEALCLD